MQALCSNGGEITGLSAETLEQVPNQAAQETIQKVCDINFPKFYFKFAFPGYCGPQETLAMPDRRPGHQHVRLLNYCNLYNILIAIFRSELHWQTIRSRGYFQLFKITLSFSATDSAH